MTWGDAYDVVDGMKHEDAEKLGFSGGKDNYGISSTINMDLMNEVVSKTKINRYY